MRVNLLFLFIFIFFIKGFGQDTASDTLGNNVKYAAIPVVFYLPETKLGFGAAGIATFKLKDQGGVKPSQIQFAAVYTLKEQLLIFMPFEIYMHKDRTRFFGEVGYYRYIFNYFGQGTNSKKEDLEVYNADYPRLVVSTTRRISKKWYIGGLYRFDDYRTKDIEPGSNVAQANGAQGGTVSSLGIEMLYDGRNQLFYPTSGSFLNIKVEGGGKWTGATYNYQKIDFDFRNFVSLGKKQVLASNAYFGMSFNNLPFFQQFFFSSGTKVRGFADRRFQDNNILVVQTEYRYPIFKRVGGVAFYGLGTVSDRVDRLFSTTYRHGYGLGLRFILNKRDKINLRLDYAKTNEGGNLYVTVKEAF